VNWNKLYRFQEMHSFQVIALVGLAMTVVAHLILWALDKQMPMFNALYPTWVGIYVSGFLLNLRSQPDDHHH
jgi:hypothetical protein